MNYFVLYLKTGEAFNFDKECKYVSNTDDKMLRFHTNNESSGKLLMIVPRDNVLYIENVIV